MHIRRKNLEEQHSPAKHAVFGRCLKQPFPAAPGAVQIRSLERTHVHLQESSSDAEMTTQQPPHIQALPSCMA